MDIAGWRRRIDELDTQIVALINERAAAALEIGKLKHATSLPVYEPGREQIIFENVSKLNRGPLPNTELKHIYERVIDVMRALQRKELAAESGAGKNRPRSEDRGRTEETEKQP